MAMFFEYILLPILMLEAGMCDAVEEGKMNEKLNIMIGKLQINSIDNNCGRAEDFEEEIEYGCGDTGEDADDDTSKKLKEKSVKKIMKNKYEGVKLREKSLKKPVVEVPLENDSIIMSSKFSERKRKRKSCKKAAKSNGASGEGSSSRNNKKSRINPREEPAPPLPIQFENAVLALAQGRTISEAKLIIQKQLFASDMAKNQNRFSIPANQIRDEFLTDEEKMNLSKYEKKGRKMAIKVKIIEPLLGEGTVELRRWDLNKDSGHSSWSYVLNRTWGTICENNKLELGNVMQLWAVRIDGELLFVLVKLP